MNVFASWLTVALLSMMATDVAVAADTPITVTTDNFVRAESDFYFGRVVKDGGFGHFKHTRTLPAIDRQLVIRLNRDTLYSSAVVDLDAGPVTLVLPDTQGRYLAAQVISEDHYTVDLLHAPGRHVLTREGVGTRYALIGVRILVNANDPADLAQTHRLQDALRIEQAKTGSFAVPAWDAVSQANVRRDLLSLATMLPDSRGMFGNKDDVDPVRHLLGAAFGWGGNPDKEATYLNVVPPMNDGVVPYDIVVRDVPVKGFWSISVYDRNGYYEKNATGIYTVNSVTARHESDGSVHVRFGGCTPSTINCIPIMKGWNYMVRLYLPASSILDGSWTFPAATPLAR